MLDQTHLASLSATTHLLFQKSSVLFWDMLPVALLIAMLTLYVSGEMTGGKLEGLFRRLLIAIAALVAFPEISKAIQGVETYLVDAFGGDATLAQIFSALGDRASQMKDDGVTSWMKVGQIGLNLISTLSFLILALVRHFLDVLHLALWNLLHVLGPIALIGCLFPSYAQVAKGIFTGMLELALWKPLWIIMARILIAAGFGEQPQDISHWFDTAVLNLTVAGLMASTPILVHAFLSGTIAGMGGAAIQTMASGAGAMMTSAPMRVVKGGVQLATMNTGRAATAIYQSARSRYQNEPGRKTNQENK